jgi:hypothetical protein
VLAGCVEVVPKLHVRRWGLENEGSTPTLVVGRWLAGFHRPPLILQIELDADPFLTSRRGGTGATD